MTAPGRNPDKYHEALRAIERTLQQGREAFDQNVTEAVARIVDIRNKLIVLNREAPSEKAVGNLRRVNAILSLVAGGEFGKNTTRIEQARDALRKLV